MSRETMSVVQRVHRRMRKEPQLRVLSIVVAALAITMLGCGDSSTEPTQTYQSIAGSYSGGMVGVSQGVTLNAVFSLNVQQNQGSVAGSYALSGILTNGVNTVDVLGTGTIGGTVLSGNNPSVNLTIKTGLCPNYSAHFSGTYDSANQRLTMTGPVDFFGDSCNVVLSYPMVIVLNR